MASALPTACHALRTAGSRHHAYVDLGLAKLGRLTGNDHVAQHGEFAAPSQSEAAHSADHRGLGLPDALPARELVALQHGDGRGVRHLRDVGTGGKRLRIAVQHDAADRRVGVVGGKGIHEFDHGLQAEGVEHLRTVQADRADAVEGLVCLDTGVFLCHGSRSFSQEYDEITPIRVKHHFIGRSMLI